jgi:hypothetical protein
MSRSRTATKKKAPAGSSDLPKTVPLRKPARAARTARAGKTVTIKGGAVSARATAATRYLVVEGVPDAHASSAEKAHVLYVAGLLADAQPESAAEGGEFWGDAESLHDAMLDKIADATPKSNEIDAGTMTIHSVDPKDPTIYKPSLDDGLPSLAYPVSWDGASAANVHRIRIRYQQDAAPSP